MHRREGVVEVKSTWSLSNLIHPHSYCIPLIPFMLHVVLTHSSRYMQISGLLIELTRNHDNLLISYNVSPSCMCTLQNAASLHAVTQYATNGIKTATWICARGVCTVFPLLHVQAAATIFFALTKLAATIRERRKSEGGDKIKKGSILNIYRITSKNLVQINYGHPLPNI